MECIEKHRHFQRGMPASSILNFRYFTCLLDKGHITKYQGGFAMYGYLQNEKINVSNATRNRPNVIKSLKSKRFFTGITPILLE